MSQYSYKKISVPASHSNSWMEKESRNILLKQQLGNINQKTMQKVQSTRFLNQRVTTSKSKINKLQEKVDESLKQYSLQTKYFRFRLDQIMRRNSQVERCVRQKQQKYTSKVKQLKSKVSIDLIKQSYISENVLAQAQHDFNKIFGPLKMNSLVLGGNKMRQDLLLIKSNFDGQIQSCTNKLTSIKNNNQFILQKVVYELEEKLTQWKKKLAKQDFYEQQANKELVNQIYQAKKQIQDDLIEQRKIRQQNKQKLLALFESRANISVKQKPK